jgi:hypothetical protein
MTTNTKATQATTYRATKVLEIPCCQGDTPVAHAVDAEWATGWPLPNGYRPATGEAVRFHSITCTRCGSWQVS